MTKLVSLLSASLFLSFLPNAEAATVKPEDLIKVDKGNTSQCVEYYTYQDGLYCSSKILNPEVKVDPEIVRSEQQNLVFDNRVWQAAWGKKDSVMVTIEYLPAGERLDHWQELVTTQYFPELQKQASLKQFSNVIMENLKKIANPEITILEETPDQIIFEFRIKEPSNSVQDEIQKIVRTDNGFYVLHYVYRSADMGQERRALWLENLKKSSIKQEGAKS
ncbi:hypothetical protein [Legionella genomosp. 1]|uniref:hypothetical protein n=1 Tax=Legionella genomosp. 1 TaxID=1093625 RepID=UPI0010552557|nr:hypothetical protein [Legionella genomosp. 1]